MLAFDLPLFSTTRPIIDLYDFTAMLDTGAGVPVFYMPVDVVLNLFGGKRIGESRVKGASFYGKRRVTCEMPDSTSDKSKLWYFKGEHWRELDYSEELSTW